MYIFIGNTHLYTTILNFTNHRWSVSADLYNITDFLTPSQEVCTSAKKNEGEKSGSAESVEKARIHAFPSLCRVTLDVQFQGPSPGISALEP
jgi:hypothetical protein